MLWVAQKKRERDDECWKWTYVISDEDGAPLARIDDCTWADWDHRGRLISVRDGCLFVRSAENLASEPRLLADLNDTPTVTFRAPDWAREWPK